MAEPDSLKLGSRPLRLADLRRVYQGPVSVQIDAAALGAVRDAHAVTARLAAADAPAYGINTGFGLLANTRIPPSQRTLLQRNIILSHSCGVGPLLDDAIVRLTLVLKLASLLQGFSGVSMELARFLERLINAGLMPCVPAQGSVGASGDLAPLARCRSMRCRGAMRPSIRASTTCAARTVRRASRKCIGSCSRGARSANRTAPARGCRIRTRCAVSRR